MTPLRPLPLPWSLALLLGAGVAACGGEGGPSGDPGGGGGTVIQLQKPAGSGDAQTGVVGDTLASALAVLVTEDGAPAPGRVVTFTPAAGAGTAAPAVDTTDGAGIARTVWILGSGAGAQTLGATTAGAAAPAVFTATAQAGPPAALVPLAGDGQAQEPSIEFAAPLEVRVVDGSGNPVAGVVVGWSVIGGSGAVAAATSASGVDGRALMQVTAGGTPGALAVRATAALVPADSVGFALTVTPVATVIEVRSNFFLPDSVLIPAGGALRWQWINGTHNVAPFSGPATFTAGPVQTAPATHGPVQFTVPGKYIYECSLHAGMTGTIVVQ